MTTVSEALVLGAGVIGLSTAIRLAEDGMTVVVCTAHEPQDTTSALATAMVGPTFAPSGTLLRAWEEATLRELSARQDGAAGVHVCRGRFASRLPDLLPPGAEDLPGFQSCSQQELPDGYRGGFWAEVPLINMPLYLDHLVERLKRAGGTIELRAFGSLNDAASLSPIVVNCSGLGARGLVPDAEVVPIRGPKITVANPGVDTFFMEGPPSEQWTCFHPHGDVVVLGGSARASEDTTPSGEEAQAIIARCALVEPRLADAVVLAGVSGLADLAF